MTIKDLIDTTQKKDDPSDITDTQSKKHVEKGDGVRKACPRCGCVGKQQTDSSWVCNNDRCVATSFTMSWKENRTGFLGDVDMVNVSDEIRDIVKDIR